MPSAMPAEAHRQADRGINSDANSLDVILRGVLFIQALLTSKNIIRRTELFGAHV